MPFSHVFQTLGALAAGLVPTDRSPRRTLEIAVPEEDDAFARAAIGRWTTEDGAIEIELKPDGRFDKAKHRLASRHQGRYEVDRSRLYFEDDSGRVALGKVRRGVLSIGEMEFRRAQDAAALSNRP